MAARAGQEEEDRKGIPKPHLALGFAAFPMKFLSFPTQFLWRKHWEARAHRGVRLGSEFPPLELRRDPTQSRSVAFHGYNLRKWL